MVLRKHVRQPIESYEEFCEDASTAIANFFILSTRRIILLNSHSMHIAAYREQQNK